MAINKGYVCRCMHYNIVTPLGYNMPRSASYCIVSYNARSRPDKDLRSRMCRYACELLPVINSTLFGFFILWFR